MEPAAASPPSFLSRISPLKWSGIYLTALKLAVLLLLALLFALFWLMHRNEADDQRSTMIADVLWLEQSVNFHLEGNAEKLQQLASDLAHAEDKHELFGPRSEYLLNNNPDLKQVVWLDAGGRVEAALPSQELPRLGRTEAEKNIQAQTLEVAAKLGRAIYTDAYRTPDAMQFEVYSPIFANGKFRGALISVYSISALLKQMVPWWFAEKYQVHVVDGNGDLLASNSRIKEVASTLSYSIPFEPPGFGMEWQVVPYRSDVSMAQIMLSTLIVTLAGAMLISLWVMRRHIKRRFAAEQALRSEHAFRKAMEDSLTVGMRARDLDGRITYVNQAFCNMVGYEAAELLYTTAPMPYWPPEEISRALEFQQSVVDGRAPGDGCELRFMRRDGSRFDVLVYEAPLIDADGRQTGWMASVIDITSRKQIEELARQQQEQLQQTSRLVSMGEIASSLAHELNQPLAAIASYNAGCLNKLESGRFTIEQLRDALNKLGNQAQRAGRIVQRVHDFVRKSEPKLASCDLVDVIDDSVGLMEADAKLRNIRILRQVDPGPHLIEADRVMLEQVLINLLRNGIESMSETPYERRKLLVALQRAGGQIEIRVTDHGSGIPAPVKEKLFSPFFSTKLHGMGMGLNICRSIIEFHHGRLEVEDHPEGGSIFTIRLPSTSP